MKILLTTDWFAPAVNGVVTSVLNLRRGLECRGHQVRILTLSQTAYSYVQGPVTYIGSFSARMVYPGARMRVALGGKELRALAKWKPDVIHSNCEFSTFFLARHLAEKLGVPLIHTYHTVYENYTHYFSPSQTWGRRAVKLFSRWVASHTDGIIAPTQKVARLLQGYGVQRPVYVVPSGIDPNLLAASASPQDGRRLRSRLGLSEGCFTLVFVGRLAKEKNCEELLRGMECLRGQPVELLLVGEGPARAELERYAAKAGIRDQVFFAGMADPKAVGAYYRLADLFVSASTSETQGLAYAEALLCGRPLLCRSDPCLDGVLMDGQNGWRYHTPEEFARYVLRFLEHPEWRPALRQKALEVGTSFSINHFAARIEAVYREQCSQKRRKEREIA